MRALYYRNPRLLVLTLFLIGVGGISSFVSLPRLEDPLLAQRFSVVITRYPGASAERVETLVTEKIEEELREIQQIRLLRSDSRAGISVISIELRDEVTEPEPVWSRIRDELDDVRPMLPRGALDPELEDREMQPEAYALVVGLTWERDDAPAPRGLLRRLAEDLEDRLRDVSGTKDTKVFGAGREEIRAEVDPVRLAALGITSAEVARTIGGSDAKAPAGQLRGPRTDLLVEVDGELDSVARVAATPLRVASDGRVVALSDVATVTKTVAEPARDRALVAGRPAVVVAARMRGDRRIDLWAERAHAVLDEVERGLPDQVRLRVVMDQSRYVADRLGSLQWNLLLGALAVIVVTLFMMGWRQALIVGLALPLSALMVLGGMNVLGIPIQQMSVTGLIIALGLLIDNAIVVVDEVGERLREGRPPADAVGETVSHLAVPLLGSTLTTVLAFMPIVLMPGGAGEFVGSIAISVILALLSSLFVSLTIVPALLAFMHRPGAAARGGWWRDGVRVGALTRGYRGALGALLARPWLGVLIAAAIPVVGFVQARTLPEQFFPPAERDQLQVELHLPQQASLERTERTVAAVRARMLEHDEVEQVHWFVGRSAPRFYYNLMAGKDGSPFYAQAIVQLRSTEGVGPVVNALQRDLDAAFPQAQVIVRQLEQGPPFRAPVELHLHGPDLRTLDALGERVRRAMASIPEVTHTRASLQGGRPQLALRFDEEEMKLAGLSHADVAEQLDAALEGRVGGSVIEATEELPVRVRTASRAGVDALAGLDLLPAASVQGAPRRPIPLLAVAEMKLVPELSSIPRRGAERVNTIEGYIETGVLPAVVVEKLEAALERDGFAPPPGYRVVLGGEAAERDRAVGNLMSKVGVLVVLMIASLVLSFGSFRMAGIIGGVAVLSVGLALAALWLFGYPFGFMAIVGSMGLVGVAVNDSIVVLAAIRADAKAATGEVEAVRDVVARSTRHVLTTTFTTMAGFTPLLIAGGGFWPPLAVAIAGGVAGATVLGLVLVPSVYVILARRGASCCFRR